MGAKILKIGFALAGLAMVISVIQLVIAAKPMMGWLGVLPLLLSLAALITLVVFAIREID